MSSGGDGDGDGIRYTRPKWLLRRLAVAARQSAVATTWERERERDEVVARDVQRGKATVHVCQRDGRFPPSFFFSKSSNTRVILVGNGGKSEGENERGGELMGWELVLTTSEMPFAREKVTSQHTREHECPSPNSLIFPSASERNKAKEVKDR